MRVLKVKTQTAANIKFPGYLEYTIYLSIISNGVSLVYGGNGTHETRELREHIYIGNLWIESALASLAQ